METKSVLRNDLAVVVKRASAKRQAGDHNFHSNLQNSSLPKLQLVIGHMGEMIPFQLARIDQALSRVTKDLKQRPSAYFQSNIHITTSGLFTAPPLYLALEVLGADRIMFSLDYPYSGTETGRRFLDNLYLSPGDLPTECLRDVAAHQPSECRLDMPV